MFDPEHPFGYQRPVEGERRFAEASTLGVFTDKKISVHER